MDKTPIDERTTSLAAAEIAHLRAENESLGKDIIELQFEADIDACHIAGLTAQIQALIAESDSCPNGEAHPLIERAHYSHSRTGQTLTKTRAFPLYRQAFDAEARRRGIDQPEKFRS